MNKGAQRCSETLKPIYCWQRYSHYSFSFKGANTTIVSHFSSFFAEHTQTFRIVTSSISHAFLIYWSACVLFCMLEFLQIKMKITSALLLLVTLILALRCFRNVSNDRLGWCTRDMWLTNPGVGLLGIFITRKMFEFSCKLECSWCRFLANLVGYITLGLCYLLLC